MKRKIKTVKGKGQRAEDSDVDEDYQVTDLSAIPAPQIEFEMPNLVPLEEKKRKTPKTSAGKSLTAENLNNEIVKMRPSAEKAVKFLSQRLHRKSKFLSKRLEKKEDKKLKRKVENMEKELSCIKNISKDEISKFALINKKTKNDLEKIGCISDSERCLYHLVFEKPMIQAVKKFKASYHDADTMTAFLLQRLGLQYSGKKSQDKNSKKPATAPEPKITSATTPDDSEEDLNELSENEEDDAEASSSDEAQIKESEASDAESNEEYSDVEMGSESSDDEELALKRRNAIFELCGISEDSARPKPVPRRKLPANENESDDEDKTPTPEKVEIDQNSVKSVLKRAIEQGIDPNISKNLIKRPKKATGRGIGKISSKTTSTVCSSQALVKKIYLSEDKFVEDDKVDSEKNQKKEKLKGDQSHEATEDDSNELNSFFINPTTARNTETSSRPSKKVKASSTISKKQLSGLFSDDDIKQTSKKLPARTKFERSAGSSRNKPKSNEEEKLHPSWVAKKQQKEQLMLQPQGKRIVFEDD